MEKRIEQLIEQLGITQKEFANQIGISAASLSHVISRRNRPSLELITKILETYSFINSDWLLFEKGDMVKRQHKDVTDSNVGERVRIEYKDAPKPIDHITVFYEDNTYCTFYQK